MVVGILGGGQLGRMLAIAARGLGIDCIAVEPAADPPVTGVVAEVKRASLDDAGALGWLAQRADVVTVELEAVPLSALQWLEAEGLAVRPSSSAVAVTQDRLTEKHTLQSLAIPTAPFEAVSAPAIVKGRTGGYDGRGQALVTTDAELAEAVERLGGPEAVIVEGVVPFDRELSIVAARDTHGAFAAYPVVENHHAGGILRVTLAPAPGLTDSLQARAEDLARRFAEAVDYVGVFAIELFQVGADLVANEIAPRVHNSGHWTTEGAATSQFEQHIRAICGLPLGPVHALGCAAMVNLIGVVPTAGAIDAVARPVPAHLHLYGKTTRPGRKLGHVTLVAPDPDTREAAVDAVAEFLGS